MATKIHYKAEIFVQLARIGKAVANGNRLELLEFLAQGSRSVDSLAQVAKLSIANTSQHLQILRQAGLVIGKKDGKHVYYSLADNSVVELLAVIRKIAENSLSELDGLISSYLTCRDNLEPLPAQKLMERVNSGTVTIIDVRPVEEFDSGHLPGAINIPLADLQANINKLPSEQEVVAYCRGPYCVLAFEAVAQLRAQGRKARRLEDGFPEWQLAGLPVEKS